MRRLLLMAKAPRPGLVKTRLCPPLTPAQAADFYRACLHDLGRRIRASGLPVRLYVAPGEAIDEVRAAMDAAGRWPEDARPQQGEGLGERMEGALRASLEDAVTVMIGTDMPDVPIASIEAAFDALEAGADLVLGPDPDGGYYLIGLAGGRSDWADLLRPEMSTSTLLEATLAIAHQRGLRTTLLEPWRDVDRWEDVERLMSRLGQDPGPWATRQWVQSFTARRSMPRGPA